MEIRIGVVDSPKEIVLEIDEGVEELVKRVNEALGGTTPVLWLKDEKDRRFAVAAAKLAYVEIDPESAPRSVGFKR